MSDLPHPASLSNPAHSLPPREGGVSAESPSSRWRVCALGVAAALLLALALAAFGLPGTQAFAAESTVASDDTDEYSPTLTLSFDQDSYETTDEINLTLTASNNSPLAWYEASIAASLPEGLHLVEGSLTAEADEVEAGGTLQLTAVLQHDSVSSAAADSTGSLPKTGDFLPILLLLLVAVAAVAATVAARRRKAAMAAPAQAANCGMHAGSPLGPAASAPGSVPRHAAHVKGLRGRTGTGTKFLSVFVALTLVTGSVPVVANTAYADDEEEDESLSLSTSVTINVGGGDYEIGATLDIASFEVIEDAEYVSLSTSDSVAKGATVAHIELTSEDAAFSESITPDLVVLYGALEDCTVESVTVEDANTLLLVITSEDGVGDSDTGVIELLEGSFEDSSVYGSAGVVVSDPEPTLEDADTTLGQGYVDGKFIIPISLDSAEFNTEVINGTIGDGATIAGSYFSVAGYESAITIESAEVTSYHDAVLTISVSGNDEIEQFTTLDTALTNAGITIAVAATNCGELTATSVDVGYGETYGYSTTALEYADALVVAVGEEKESTLSNDGSLDVVIAVNLYAVEGSVYLTKKDQIDFNEDSCNIGIADDDPNASTDNSQNSELDCLIDNASINLTSSTSFDMTVTVPLDTLTSFYGLDGDTSSLSEEERSVVIDVVLNLQNAHDIEFAGSSVFNSWGIEEAEAMASCVSADVVDTLDIDQSSQSADTNSLLVSSVTEEDESTTVTDESTTKEQLEVAEKCFETAASFSESIGALLKKDPDYGESAGGFFDTIAGMLGIADASLGEGYSLADVMNSLSTIKKDIQDINNEVEGLGIQLDTTEKRLAFEDHIDQLEDLVGIAGNYASVIETTSSQLKDHTDYLAMSYDELPQDVQNQMVGLSSALEAINDNGKTNSYTVATSLGNLIFRGTTGAEGVVDEYFDYVDTYYNWESTTLAAREAFLVNVESAYIASYLAASLELNNKIDECTNEKKELQAELDAEEAKDESEQDKNKIDTLNTNISKITGTITGYTTNQSTLYTQATNVYKKLVGDYDVEEKDDTVTITPKADGVSATKKRTETSSDGTNLNLVNSKTYSSSSFTSTVYGGGSLADWFQNDISKIKNETTSTIQNTSTITEAQWEAMAKRVESLHGNNVSIPTGSSAKINYAEIATIKDELVAVGLLAEDANAAEKSATLKYSIPSYADTKHTSVNFMTATGAKTSTVSEMSGLYTYLVADIEEVPGRKVDKVLEKDRYFTTTVFDISTHTETVNHQVIWMHRKYHGNGWHADIQLQLAMVALTSS